MKYDLRGHILVTLKPFKYRLQEHQREKIIAIARFSWAMTIKRAIKKRTKNLIKISNNFPGAIEKSKYFWYNIYNKMLWKMNVE